VVRLRQGDLLRWGFDPVEVLEIVRTAYGGDTLGQIYDGNRVFDVAVILAPGERRTISEIGALALRSPEGNYVPLVQIAAIYESSGRYIILHQVARRVQKITCNVEGRDLAGFVEET
jgi:Cu/Ag efflux pump CusA